MLQWQSNRYYILWVCDLVLVIRHIKHMRRIVLPSVVCLTLPLSPYCLINGTIFGKEFPEYKNECFEYQYNFALKTFHSKTNSVRPSRTSI
jgi:hypothetical protein